MRSFSVERIATRKEMDCKLGYRTYWACSSGACSSRLRFIDLDNTFFIVKIVAITVYVFIVYWQLRYIIPDLDFFSRELAWYVSSALFLHWEAADSVRQCVQQPFTFCWCRLSANSWRNLWLPLACVGRAASQFLFRKEGWRQQWR